jgi:hypothetical protein
MKGVLRAAQSINPARYGVAAATANRLAYRPGFADRPKIIADRPNFCPNNC